MRNLLAFLAALTLTVAVLGWYLDWYRVRSQPAPEAGHRNLTIDFNTVKIGEDLHKGEQNLQKMLDSSGKHPQSIGAARSGPDTPVPGRAAHKDGKAAAGQEESEAHKPR